MIKNEVGNKYGRLTVIERVENNKFNFAQGLCVCECGKYTKVPGNSLRSGNTKSCGCLNDEIRRNTCRTRSTTHGMTHTRLYQIWNNMKQRIKNEKNPRYTYYGGRGIKLCKEWERFEDFRDWAFNNGYNDELTIDRINNDGDYSPQNCRWTTQYTQSNNKRTNVFIEYKGKRQTIAQWAVELNINVPTLWMRLYHYKWTVEKSLTCPVAKRRRKL